MCVFTHLVSEPSDCKWRWGGGWRRRRRVEETEEQWERREAYWGQQRALLSVISIQMCRIRCSECGSARGWKLVLFPTQPWSRQGQIQTNEFTQTIHMEHWRYRGVYEWQKQWRDVKQRGLCLRTPSSLQPLSFLTILNSCQHFTSMQPQGDFPISHFNFMNIFYNLPNAAMVI